MGLVLAVVVILTFGMVLSHFSRLSNRTSHWFFLSQAAFGLAEGGLHEAVAKLRVENQVLSSGTSSGIQALLAQLQSAGPLGQEVVLFQGSSGLPPGLQAQVDSLSQEGITAEVEVVGRRVRAGPLIPGGLQGIPEDPQEIQGKVQLIARASVARQSGVAVTRSLVWERQYRRIHIRPDLLGRFGLYLHTQVDSPNQLGLRVLGTDTNWNHPRAGDTERVSGPGKLVLDNGIDVNLMQGRTLDRAALSTAVGGQGDFLDRQGWVYLGQGTSGFETWDLKLAHGFGPEGESFLLDGRKGLVRYGGSMGEDQAFRDRIETYTENLADANPTSYICRFQLNHPTRYGLFRYRHGFATNWHPLGHGRVADVVKSVSQDTLGYNFRTQTNAPESGLASNLRLFGTPDAFSPTLVFGPVHSAYIQKAEIKANLTGLMCGRPGRLLNGPRTVKIFLPNDPNYNIRSEGFLEAAFGTANPQLEGTGVHGPGYVNAGPRYLEHLPTVLNTRFRGSYLPPGPVFGNSGGGGPVQPYQSQLVPNLGVVSDPDQLHADGLDEVYQGKLSVPKLFRGNLGNGLRAYMEVLMKKRIYDVFPENREAVLARLIDPIQGSLDLPGVVIFRGTEPLRLPAIASVFQGGTILAEGDLILAGSIQRGQEPLTLVSLRGDIEIEAGGSQVEAYLVAATGTLRVPSGGATIKGGLALRELRFANLPAQDLKIVHDPGLDPLGRGNQDYRFFYGDAPEGPRIAAGGGR